MITIKTDRPEYEVFVSFDTNDELPEILCTHLRGKTVDVFIAPANDPSLAPDRGYIGSRKRSLT